MHNWGHGPTLVDVSGHVRACPSLFPTFPFPQRAAAINFRVFRITFPSGEEWSVKSNLRNARPPIHNFSGCNYANDRSFSDLYPSAYMDGGLPVRQPAFCFRALYHFVTAREPALKCWGAHLFERQHDFFFFFCCSFSFILCLLFAVYVSVSVTFSLFLFWFLYSHVLSLCSLSSLVLSLSPRRYPPKARSWTKSAFLFWMLPSFKGSETCVRWIAFSHNYTHENIQTHACTHRIGDHILNPAASCCANRCQKYSPSTSAHDFVLRLPLALYSWIEQKLPRCFYFACPVTSCNIAVSTSLLWCLTLQTKSQIIYYFLKFEIRLWKLDTRDAVLTSTKLLKSSDLKTHWFVVFSLPCEKKKLWFDKLQSNGTALFTSTLSNRHVSALCDIFWISLQLPFPHFVHRVHISLISMLLLTKAPSGLALRMSLNADILLSKSKGCDLEYIQSWVLSQCYTSSSCGMFVFIPLTSIHTLPFLPSISSLGSTCSYVTLIKLHYAVMQCRAELLPLLLFVLVLIVTFLTLLQLGKPFFFSQVASCSSSLPTGRRVSLGPCRSLVGARASGHLLSAEDAEYLPPQPPENELGWLGHSLCRNTTWHNNDFS